MNAGLVRAVAGRDLYLEVLQFLREPEVDDLGFWLITGRDLRRSVLGPDCEAMNAPAATMPRAKTIIEYLRMLIYSWSAQAAPGLRVRQ